MAGARPEYFPVILAMAATGVSARGSTSSSAAAMAVVNGPIRNEIGMNCGIGAMGPYNHANATIGRAYGLLSQNCQGGSVPGHSYMGSQGNNYSYNNLTFAENEERSPWEPFHVQKGFQADETRERFRGCRSTAFTLGLREKYWREHVRSMLRGWTPAARPSCSIRSRRVSSSTAAASTQGEADRLDPRKLAMPAKDTGTTNSSRTTSTRAPPSARSLTPRSSRPTRTS